MTIGKKALNYQMLMSKLADNNTGDITPQTMRELLESIAIVYGTVENDNLQEDVPYSSSWSLIDCSGKQTGSDRITASKADSSITILEDGYYKVTAYIDAGGSGFNWTDAFQIAIQRNGVNASMSVNLVAPIFSNEEFNSVRVETVIDNCKANDKFTLVGRRVNTTGQAEPITFRKTWLNVEKQPVVYPVVVL